LKASLAASEIQIKMTTLCDHVRLLRVVKEINFAKLAEWYKFHQKGCSKQLLN